jgi:hypothetical protein
MGKKGKTARRFLYFPAEIRRFFLFFHLSEKAEKHEKRA